MFKLGMAPAGQSSSQPLPPKDLAVFRRIVKCYENKQFKVGLKLCKNILGNPHFSEHGETLSMKGLILNCMGKDSEAQDCVKRGLTADIKSYVCWHVYGLVQRQAKKYDEAIKAYKMALRLDKENLQILRDICLLQIQLRDFEGYRDSRYTLLKLRPTQRVSWIGYATAYHLLKDYEKALNIVGEFIANNQPTSKFDFEHAELVLYQNMIIRESGQPQLALDKLEENCLQIVDKLAYHERRADLLIELGRKDEAANVYRQLLDRNAENLFYYDRLEQCLGLGEGADVSKRLALFDELAAKYPRAAAPRRQPLYIAEGDELRKRLLAWMVSGLRKGAPSLFKNLIPLYKVPTKVQLIEAMLTDFVKKLEDNGYKNGCLDGTGASCESPTTALWLYYLLAQHYDRIGNTTMALVYVERAIQHTPTLIELLMIKAKISKHSGDHRGAAQIMDYAQSLDTADRYINSKCAKYLLRAGLIQEAEDMCAKFTREGVNASVNLNEMQCMWYELEVARAHRQLNNYGEALKKCHQIEQHFVCMVEDQFDFHTYCLRKMTLCAYIGLLRLEDTLRKHEWYYHAAKCAVKIYLRMIDRPEDMHVNRVEEVEMSAADLKKMKRKQAKEKARLEAEQKASGKDKAEPKKEEGLEGPVGMHLDPEALVNPENPLEEAAKFISHIVRLGCNHVTGYYLGFEVYFRKEKPLLMLQCLNEARKIDATHPLLHVCSVKFLKFLSTYKSEGVLGELVEELTNELFGKERSGSALNEKYKQEHIGEMPARIAVAECNLLLDPSTAGTTKNWLLKSIEDPALSGRTLKMFVKLRDGIQYGRYGVWTNEEQESLSKVAHSLYKDSNVFGGGTAAFNKESKEINGNVESAKPAHTFE